MSGRIYLDYASLTPLDSRVKREIGRFYAPKYANPSSLYKEGVLAKKIMEECRGKIGLFLGAHPDEIFFTGGGTEANGLAIEGAALAALANGIAKPHLIISKIEHSSIMECAGMLEHRGLQVTRLPVDSTGRISTDELKKSIKPSTFMVSIMAVNNEIGTAQPLKEIARIIRRARSENRIPQYPLFHSDAAQAVLYYDLQTEVLGLDLLTVDGGKACGPGGSGVLYVKRGTPIEPIIRGGGQERGLRSGTENLPAISGLALALEIAGKERNEEIRRLSRLKKDFLDGLWKIRPDIRLNGPPVSSPDHGTPDISSVSPHILNISIPGIDNEFFTLRLDAKGIAVSTKSSCLRDQDESYVLRSIGADNKTSVRFSFGRWTTGSHIRRTLAAIGAMNI